MQSPTILHSYVNLNNSYVHLVQYCGPNDENVVRARPSSYEPNQSSSSSSPTKRNLIIFIPGNPGMLGVYHDYLCALYRTICRPSSGRKGQPIILAISHNNFDHPDCCDEFAGKARKVTIDESELNFVEKSMMKNYAHDPHNIEMQVINKLIILKRLVLRGGWSVPLTMVGGGGCGGGGVEVEPELDPNNNETNDNVVFIGHSIGCYVILKLLQDKQLNELNHRGSIMIHPAFENLALTKKGSFTSTCFTYKVDLLMKGVAFIMDTILPKTVKINLTKWLSSPEFVEKSSAIVLESLTQMAAPISLRALIDMAKSEFNQVKNINNTQMIEPHLDKLHLIYAQTDHWVNKEHREELLRLYESRISIEEEATLHAFIMDPQTVSNYAVKVGMLIEDLIGAQ